MNAAENKKFNEEIGLRIRVIRKMKKINQDKVAQALGLTRTSFVNMEKGRQQLNAKNIYTISKLLDVSPGDIFPGTGASISLSVEATIADLNEQIRDWRAKYFDVIGHLNKIKGHLNKIKEHLNH